MVNRERKGFWSLNVKREDYPLNEMIGESDWIRLVNRELDYEVTCP